MRLESIALMPRIRILLAVIAVQACSGAALQAQTASPSTTPADFDARFAEAVSLHQAGDLLGAMVLYEELLKSAPQNPGLRSNLGAALSRLGRFEAAIEQYRLALATDDANATYRFNLALALYKAARPEEAAAEFERVLAQQGENKNALLLLADSWLQAGQPRKAVTLLEPREAVFAGDRAYAYVLGSALIESNELARGNALIERLLREGSAEAYLLQAASKIKPLIGNRLADMADWDAAIGILRQARRLNPKLPGLNFAFGQCLLSSRDWEGAGRAFRDELELNPNHFESNLLLGNLRRDEGRYDDALIYLKRAAQMRAQDSRVLYSLATVYVATERFEEARPLLEKVAELVPESLKAHITLATVYARLKRESDAERERALVKKLSASADAEDPLRSTTSREEEKTR
jgi:tetratricopeptide (TPR) repeat protein